ncbi:Uncharacterised protein [Streptococcus pneumoniae]|nr:Uncharacterised protein [Streptococcus pneumoniae]
MSRAKEPELITCTFCSARSPKRMIDPLPKSFSINLRASFKAFSRSAPNFFEISSNFFGFFAILFSYILMILRPIYYYIKN